MARVPEIQLIQCLLCKSSDPQHPSKQPCAFIYCRRAGDKGMAGSLAESVRPDFVREPSLKQK